jgi:transcriptional regulator with XRE-family HTH domain
MDATKCGAFIAKLRIEREMTQKELSEALNVSDKAISRWETGKGYPDVSSLMALSEFFSVSVNELLSGKRIDIEKLSTTADENVLAVIRKNERINKKQVAIYTLLLIIAISPVLIILGKSLFEAFITEIKVENILTSVISFVIAVAILIVGLIIKGGNLSVLHSYHYANVTDVENYSREMGTALAGMSVPIIIHSFLSLFYQVKIVSVVGATILIIGLIVSTIRLFKIQVEYNGSLF